MENTNRLVRRGPINPFVDWGFKYVFGREENKDLLLGFLNFLLEPEVCLRDIRYLNTELLGDIVCAGEYRNKDGVELSFYDYHFMKI